MAPSIDDALHLVEGLQPDVLMMDARYTETQ